MFPLVTGSNRPIFPKSSVHLKEKIREGNDLSTHILKQAVFDNQKLIAYMYLSEHLRKHTFMWDPGEKINLKELAIWKHFLEMGTSYVLNAESSNLWRITDLRVKGKKAFPFSFVQFCVIGIYMPIWFDVIFKNNNEEERSIIYIPEYEAGRSRANLPWY